MWGQSNANANANAMSPGEKEYVRKLFKPFKCSLTGREYKFLKTQSTYNATGQKDCVREFFICTGRGTNKK